MKLKISDASDCDMDLEILMKTRLLIQANSGGGKSYLLRRLAEQAFGKVQVIIIDPEGEFSTLREKFDYVLVGKGGETPADCRSAGLVAHKLLELHASAVCDLYEMKPHDRHQWVKLFIDALIDAPKHLWHSLIVIVDEAHVFCPESKAGESVASGAMIDLATRGRKRGYCAIFATQRLGKLKKDAAAELTNVMIGQTFIDIDRDRAAEALGVSGKERAQFDGDVKTIEAGNFYALGRAICTTKTKILIGKVQTTHPEIGGKKFSAEPPPPSEKVKLMMPKLADLPKLADEKVKTEADLRSEIRSLKARVAAKPSQPAAGLKNVPALTDAERKRLTSLIESYDRMEAVCGRIETLAAEIKQSSGVNRAEILFFKTMLADKLSTPPLRAAVPLSARPVVPAKSRMASTYQMGPRDPSMNGSIGAVHRKFLTVLANRQDRPTRRNQLAVISGYSSKSSHVDNTISNLRVRGLIHGERDSLVITAEGLAELGSYDPLPSGEALVAHWVREVGSAGGKMLTALVEAYPNTLSRDELAEVTGFSVQSSHVDNTISGLRTRELVTGPRDALKASEEFFS